MDPYETIAVDHDDQVAIVTLSRPDRMNAVVPKMIEELNQALDAASDARCILFTGAGRAFCSGADLAVRATSTPAGMTSGEASHERLTKLYNPFFLRLSRLPVPIVVAVNGPAVGIGCSLALAGDFVLMGRSAYLLEAFVNVGLVPDGGASWTLPRLVGKARAMEMMMLGERIGADKAETWGLVHKAAPDETLMEEARALAHRLANGPTFALGLMRQTIAAALEADYASALALEAANQHRATDSSDAQQATAAFLEKRKPVFTGR